MGSTLNGSTAARATSRINAAPASRNLGADNLDAACGPAAFQQPGRSAVYSTEGMCATSHPLAAAMAVEVLRAGGNAIDAGVTAAFLLTVCEPMMTGLGGDCFALYAPPNGPVIALNAAGRAPAGFDIEKVRAEQGAAISTESAHAVTVPGAVGGLCALMARFGKLDLAQVTAPARHYARAGVPVGARTARDWVEATPRLSEIARRHLLREGGRPYAMGDVFKAPGIGAALEFIARDGASGFYQGPIAEDIVDTLATAGGAHKLDDLAAAKPFFTDPIFTDYRGCEVYETPPNAQGATALLMLDMLAPRAMSSLDPRGADRIHLEIETGRLAYETRDRHLCDPETGDGGLAELRAPGLAHRLGAEINLSRARPWPTKTDLAAKQRDTVVVTTVDADGGALSLIMSVFHSFGSGMTSERYGLVLHNRGAGFTLEEGHPNVAAPGKRPLHTLSPVIAKQDGRTVMSFGVMGGQYQAYGHARLLSNLLDYGFDLQSAIDLPRVYFEDEALILESGHAPLVAEQLAARGHNLRRADGPIGGAQAIWIDHERGVLCGASDPRKDGCALGY